MPGSHKKKDKLKSRLAELNDVTKNHKEKPKKKDKLIHGAKGVIPTYTKSKVNKRKLKGKVSKLKGRLAGMTHPKKKDPFPIPKDKAGKPLWNVDDDGNPVTKADRMKRYKHEGTINYDAAGTRVTPKEYKSGSPRITDKDVATQLQAKEHDHSIHFKGYKGQYYKRASLVSTQGKYAKYWLLNAKQTNGNGWGVSQQSIAKNIHKFVGKPLVVTAKSWIPDSVYGDAYEHPYLPTNDISKVMDHQEKYRVGSIVDIIEKDGDYFANIEINQRFAHMVMPPFCSPAIFQNDPSEAEGQISDWEALHLAALHEDPAYGSRIALLRGTCVGTQDQCTVQFKAAKQEAKVICTKDLKGRLATLKKNDNLKQRLAVVSPTVMNQKDGETIANAYDKMLHEPNNPGVKESYGALIKETEDQFNELKKNGLRIDAIKPGENPYQTADDLHKDLKKNNHLYFYPSEQGFGNDDKFNDHPMLGKSGVTYKGKKLPANDVFRIVHDINGHNLANSDFTPEGEHNAFLSHRKMYSKNAGKALFTETAGQANWGAYNKKSGANNRKLIAEGRYNDLVFADQKAGLLSDDIINTEWHTGTSKTSKLKQRLADVAPERVLSSEAESNIAGVEIQDLSGEKTELQKRTFNRGVRLKKQQSDDAFERMRSQYISEDNIKKNKWAKLKQRLGVIGMPEPFEDRYKTVKNTKSNLSSFKIEDPEMDYILGKTDKIKPKKQGLDRLVKNRWAKQRLIRGKQRNAVMSKKASQIVNSFKQSGFDPTGISGVWDADNGVNLDATVKEGLDRLWDIYGRRGMGFNSITNTIKGPNTDVDLLGKQLTEIEEQGGIPALGFDNGSLEAVNVTYGTKDEVLDKLLPHQNSTGYIDEDGKLDIPDNPRYKDYLKEIEK